MSHSEVYIDGIWHPSVTTIISGEEKPWLKAWRDKWGVLAERKTAVASAIGTAFHHAVEQYLDTGAFTIHMAKYDSCVPRVTGMVESWIDWAASIDGLIYHTEMKVVSKAYTYSGTLDAVGVIDGTRLIIDWKTSSRIYPEMALQLSAYAQAYKEEASIDIKQGLIVHVSKDKPRFKLTTKTFKLGKRIFNEFLKLREMFDDVQKEPIV